ncbi:MAG: hypothetical protein E7396_05265 [Ruminococcaceae bacterium]|nr:hypothetical protein [Oscillospiraceae bacterium]
MAKKMKRLLSLFVCVVMIVSSFAFTTVAGAAQFKDMPNNWSTAALTHAVNNDLLRGKGDGMLCPDDYLTRAEMATVINRAFNAKVAADISAYLDVSPSEWYHNEFGKALNMQTFYGTGDNMFRPQNTITREEVFIAIARALVVSTNDYSVLDKFDDGSDVSSWAKEFVSALVSNGYVNGYGNGLILPKNNITRAEFAQLLYNIFKQYITEPGTYDDVVNDGGVVIRNEGISLSDVTINGDLVIADGVGEGILTLKNVKVNGRLLVRGSKQITVTDCVFTEGIVVKNVNGVVHFDNYRSEPEFNILTEVTKATFKDDSYSIGFGGGSSGGSGGSGGPADIKYNITLNLNGGSLAPGVNNVLKWRQGSTLATSNLPVVSKPNFIFGGWYKDAAFTESFTSEVVTGAFDLYAKWMAEVTFDSVGGSTVPSEIVEIGATVAEPATPTLTNKVFSGWYVDSAYTTAFNFATPITQNTTLYARWTDIPITTYTVTFNSMGGSAVAPVTVNENDMITEPAHPSKTGYDFAGWYKDSAYTQSFAFNTEPIVSDITLYAKWTIKTFTVTFVTGNGATIIPPYFNVPYDTLISNPGTPSRTGYSFAGWYKGENGTGGVFDFATDKITANTTIYAHWNSLYYKLHYNTLGGTINGVENPFVNVNHGESTLAPDDPVKPNAVFGGWFKDAEYTTPFVFMVDEITEETTIYAKWTYTVEFNTNGGSFVAPQPVVHGKFATEPQVPSNPGNFFGGWFIDAACTVAFNFETPVTESTTLYAKWSPIPVTMYTVTFYSDGGSAVAPQTVSNGSKITKPADPTKEGYTFNGWLKPDNSAFDFANDTITGNITLKATWTINEYTVTFNPDNGEATDEVSVNHGDLVARPTDPSKIGYTFDKWTKLDGTEFDFSTPITGNITLKATWTKNEYTVTFDANGGYPVPAAQTVEHGECATKPADPAKQGFDFLGWYIGADEYNFATYVTSGITLVARWEVKKFTVSFDSMGGSSVSPVNNVEYGTKINEPSEPSMTGYTFKGWYKDTNYVNSFDFANDVIISNITLYAKWEISEYTVTFETYGGSVINPQTVTHGNKANKPYPNPVKDGHTFVKWINVSGDEFDFNTPITKDTELYAQWLINKYLVEFETNGGSAVDSQLIEYEGYVTEPTAPTKDGYIFEGWYKEDTFVNEFDFASDIITKDTTLYAKWEPIPVEYVTVTFVTNCANTLDDEEIIKGTKISQPTVENQGYTLVGWYTTEDFQDGTKIDFDTYTFDVSITIYAKWEANPVYYTVKFYDGMSDEYLEGEETYLSGSLIPQSDIPAATKYNYEGFYKDSTISSLYAGDEYQHYIDPLWLYKGDDDKWKVFDLTTDIVEKDLELHYGAKWLELAAYVNQLNHEFQVKTPYELDLTDSYLTNVFKDMLFRNRNNLNNAYNLPQVDEKKAQIMSKLTASGLIDEDKNILIQYIKLRFAQLIGEENLRDFIVENAKKQLSSNDGLKDTLTEYIDSHSEQEVEKLIIKAIDKQLNNPITRDETIQMIEELVLDVIERNPAMFADMIEDYIETEIAEGREDDVESLIVKIITDGMDADTLKTVALKVDMKPYIDAYIDDLTIDQLKSYYDKIVNKFINNENFKTYINEYAVAVDDDTLKAFMKGYINTTGEGKVFSDYLTDMTDEDLTKYISDNLKDVIDDVDINEYITGYIEGLSEAKFKEYTTLYINSLDADTKESYIKTYLDTLTTEELASRVADYVLGLEDVAGELKTYIGKISDEALVEYISNYIKENTTNATIVGYIIDYVKTEIAAATPNATVMSKVTEFVTGNASSIDEVKSVMKDVLPKYAKTISEAAITSRITEYFDTAEGQADFINILRKYLASEGYTQSNIDSILSNDAEILTHKTEAIEYVVDEIRKNNSEVFEKDPVTGEFTNTWVNVDKVASSFISNTDFIAEMITVPGVMGEILKNGNAVNVITAKETFRTQIMNMLVDPLNQTVMNSAVQNVISNPTKKTDVINKVITSLLAGDDNNDKTEVKALVLKMITKQGKDETVNELTGYLKDNLDTNDYALTGVVNYVYENRNTEIAKIVSHIKKPAASTLVIKISSEIVAVPADRAEIIRTIVSVITKTAYADKKSEIIDQAINKLVSDSEELTKYITSIFENDDEFGTKKNTFVSSIKNVIFANSSTAKADIKQFVNVIISSSNTFGKRTLISTYIDDIWTVEDDRTEFIGKIAEEFVTKPLVRAQVMVDAIEAINNTPALKDDLVNRIIAFIEESDDHMEAVVEKVVQKMMGDGTTPGDDTLKEEMIDFIVKYLKEHPEDLDDIVDEVLEDDPNVDGELGDILNEFVRQLIKEDKFVINKENKFIAEGMQIKLSEMTEYTDLFEMLPENVEKLYKKIEKFLPKDIIQRLYSETVNAYLAQLTAGINAVTDSQNGEAETFMTMVVNPVIDLLNPLYERAMNKAEMKLNNHFAYNENEYLQELVHILTPEAMLEGDDSLATDILSGYKFKEFDDYYFLLMRLSVLTDDTAQWYMDNVGQEKTEQYMDSIQSRVLKAFSYYNKFLAIVDEYTKTRDLPDKLDNEYVNKLINILDSKFPFFDKLLDKFDGSKVDRPLKDSDYEKLYQIVDLLFRNRTFVADDLFDSSYADKLNKFRYDEDTYKVTNDKVGTARMEREYE